METLIKYLPIVVAWLVFGVIHSLAASEKVKRNSKISPLGYRRLYNLLSLIMLLGIFFLGATYQPEYLIPKSQATKAVGLIIATFGFLLAKLAFNPISFKEFVGIKKEDNPVLVTTGIYGRMRHPLYMAIILGAIGFFVFSPSITNFVHMVCIIIYLRVGIYFEEKQLLRIFGKLYERYREQTPLLLPNLRK